MDEEKKELQTIGNDGASIRKKSELKKAADSFIVEDAKTVGSALLRDIIIPSIKKTVSELGKTAIDMFLYGRAGKTSSAPKTYSNASYRRPYDRVEAIDTPKKVSRDVLEYDEILFETWEKAEEVRLDLLETVKKSGVATVAELYEFSGLKTDNYMHNKWGWANLTGTMVKAVYDNGDRRFMIKLPKPIPIDWVD